MPQKAPDTAAVDAAIDWVVALRFNHAEPEIWARFNTWRAADPANDAAWRRLEAMHADFPTGPQADLTRSTLTSLYDRRGGRRRALKIFSGLGLLGGSLLVTREFAPWQRFVADYSTGYGERRTWALDDGTQVVLNTDSAIDVQFSALTRRVHLLRGEMQVITGADAGAASKRPLFVDTAFGSFEPIGTTFLLALKRTAAELSVQDGAVAIRPRTSERVAVAQAGETWSVQTGDTYRVVRPPIEPGAWLRGTLVVQDMPLGDLIAELSRYRLGYLHCDARVAQRRITAVVHLDNLDRALDFLAAAHGLTITRHSRYWITVAAQVST
ncbi:MAG: FecR domain-containing protein [Achromobacter sp.]|jgi:ferric-dicitrate binding protein FerR (iron transport regulator)